MGLCASTPLAESYVFRVVSDATLETSKYPGSTANINRSQSQSQSQPQAISRSQLRSPSRKSKESKSKDNDKTKNKYRVSSTTKNKEIKQHPRSSSKQIHPLPQSSPQPQQQRTTHILVQTQKGSGQNGASLKSGADSMQLRDKFKKAASRVKDKDFKRVSSVPSFSDLTVATSRNSSGTSSDNNNAGFHPWIGKEDLVGMKRFSCSSFANVRVIGTGLMGTAVLTKHKPTGKYVVLKSIKKAYIIKHGDTANVFNEKKVLERVEHRFVYICFGTFQSRDKVFFVLEYCAGGDLFRLLHNPPPNTTKTSTNQSKRNNNAKSRNQAKPFGVNQTRFYLCEIITVLIHLHSLGYCYKDLKPENIMISDDGHVKVIDFGFCCLGSSSTAAAGPNQTEKPNELTVTGMHYKKVGTPQYLSPEVLNCSHSTTFNVKSSEATNTNTKHKITTNGRGYTNTVDYWSLGILAYEMLTLKTPFCKDAKSDSEFSIYLRVLKGKINFNYGFDNDAKVMIRSLLKIDCTKRVTSPVEVKGLDFFRGVNWSKVEKGEYVPPWLPVLGKEGDETWFDDFSHVCCDENEEEGSGGFDCHGDGTEFRGF